MAMVATQKTSSDARRVVATLRENPRRFVRRFLGGRPWSASASIMDALTEPRARVTVRACHSSGKTWSAAQIVLWWVYTGGIVVTTATTGTQVRMLLWKEIRNAHSKARIPLGGEPLTTELHLFDDCYAIGLSTNDESRFQGYHGDRVLVIVDEAQGVRPAIYNAIEGIRAGGDVRVLLIGNPLVTGGYYYDSHTRNRAAWSALRIDAFDTPNLRGLALPEDGIPISPERPRSILELTDDELVDNARPYLTRRDYVAEKWHEWGADSPLWRAKVRGEFPEETEDALYKLAWLERARLSDLQPKEDDPIVAGIDVAGEGEDETVLRIRHGPRIIHRAEWPDRDPRGEVAAELHAYRDRLTAVNVDSGGMGHYFAIHLTDLGFPVVPVNFGEGATDPKKHYLRKAEIYCCFRDALSEGRVSGLTDETEYAQLTTVRAGANPKGQIVIESKKDARRRGVRSPDRAEATVLAFAEVEKGGVRSWLA